MSKSNLAARAVEDGDLVTDAKLAAATEVVEKELACAPGLVVVPDHNAAKFGSAESALDTEVAADIEACNRANGNEEIFESQEERIRRRLPAAYKSFRRAAADPAYSAVLAKKLLDESGGTYHPSAKKPWNLAAHLALRPNAQYVTQAYEAAYYFRHASIADVAVEDFGKWIEGRNLKASRDFVRARTKRANGSDSSKPVAYPNLAKARTLKGDDEVRDILKMAKDIAESDLAKLFAARANASGKAPSPAAKAA